MGKFSEKAHINKIAIIGHLVLCVVLMVAYGIELAKGNRTVAYYLVFTALILGPALAEVLCFRRNKDTDAIKHIICIGYGIFYLFVIFTTNNGNSWTYAFPLLMIVILYMDVRCCGLVGGGATLGNIVYVIYHGMTVGYSPAEMADIEIRVACMLLVCVFLMMATSGVKKVNDMKMLQIKEQTEAAQKQSERILSTSEGMISEITEVAQNMEAVAVSMDRMHSSMSEVSTGSAETTEAVQKQLVRTEEIQAHIGKVKETVTLISENMAETAEKVTEGKERMDVLTAQVNRAMAANDQVLSQMQVLSEYTSQMNTIIEAITSIANSTGMLALNASIEAARAGEAGRGFAVVATQVSGLSSETKSATVHITQLIENINAELETVRRAIDEVTESNRENTETTRIVSEGFMEIAKDTEQVEGQAGELLEIVKELESANKDIVENIQTISAITEEVSAHANETYGACEENTTMVNAVSGLVTSLNDKAQTLVSEEA